MINTFALISHSSLFEINPLPGNVFNTFTFMMKFYSFRFKIVENQKSNFTIKDPYNFKFAYMGYNTTNFIPL